MKPSYLVLKSELGDRDSMDDTIAAIMAIGGIMDSPLVRVRTEHPAPGVIREIWVEAEVGDHPLQITLSEDEGLPGRYLSFEHGTPRTRRISWKKASFLIEHWAPKELIRLVESTDPPPRGSVVKLGMALAGQVEARAQSLVERMLRHEDRATVVDAAQAAVVARWSSMLPALSDAHRQANDGALKRALEIGVQRLREVQAEGDGP